VLDIDHFQKNKRIQIWTRCWLDDIFGGRTAQELSNNDDSITAFGSLGGGEEFVHTNSHNTPDMVQLLGRVGGLKYPSKLCPVEKH